MAITDFSTYKPIEVTSASGNPTISRALCFKITSGDGSTTGTGEIVLDWSNISSQADIGVYDENDNLLDYYFESFDATNETAVIWVYRDWVRDGSVQAKIAYGSGPSDQSVVASTVFDKESSLQAGYLFNESSGDLLDVTSNNNDGTVYGATQGESGIVDGAYSFDGVDNYISLNHFSKPSSLVILLWAITSGSDIHEMIAWTKDQSNGDAAEFRIKNGKIEYGQWDDSAGNFQSVTSSDLYNDGNWHLLAVVQDADDITIYGDTSQDGSGTISNSVSTDTLTLGAFNRDGLSNFFVGKIDCARIYNSLAVQTDIQSFYAATKSSPDFFSQQAVAVAVIYTDSPTNVTSTSATLNGTLDDLQGNSSLDVYFEYGTDTSYGNTTTTQTISSVPTSFSADISGLTAFTTYHYRAVATDGSNYWYGRDVSFYTVDLRDVDETQSELQHGTLTDVEADSGDYLRLADTDVLSLDGTTEGSTNYSGLGNSESRTYELFFYPTDDSVSGSILGRWGGDVTSDLALWLDGNGNVSVQHYDGSTGTAIQKTLELNAWNHIALVWDNVNKELLFYYNATLIGSKSGLNAAQSTSNNIELFEYFAGKANELRIWDTVRTQTQLQDNMNKRLNGDESNLLIYYKLDEGSGTTATDSAGSNDGTINGASWVSNEPLYFMNANEDNNRLIQLDLSSLSTYSDSLIEWAATLNGQSLTIETRYSLDGGSSWSSWQTATNGDPIPGLSSGDDLSNALLECRETLSTSDATVTPQLERRAIYLVEGAAGGTTAYVTLAMTQGLVSQATSTSFASLTYSTVHGFQVQPTASASSAVSLAKQLGVSTQSTVSSSGNVNLGTLQAGVSNQGTATTEGTTTLNTTLNNLFSGTASTSSTFSIASILGISTQTAGTITEVYLTLAQNFGITNQSTASATGNTSLGVVFGLTQQATSQAESALTLAYDLAVNTSSLCTSSADISLAIQNGVNFQGSFLFEGQVDLGYNFDAVTKSTANSEGSLSLNQIFSITSIAEAIADAGLTLDSIYSLTFDEETAVLEIVTPSNRLLTVKLQIRNFIVPQQDRNYKV